MEEILEANYVEHLKHAKELAMYLPQDHPKRVRVEKAINEHISDKKSTFKANKRT